MSEILARPSLRKEDLRKPQDKKNVPAKQHGTWRKVHTLKAEVKATYYSPVEVKAPVPVSKNTEERMFVVDSGASMHMLRKKDLSSDEMDTVRRTPTTVVTANGEVQTNEEAQVYVYDLDLFVTVQVLDERQQFYRLVSFAQNTDVQMSGRTVKFHD